MTESKVHQSWKVRLGLAGLGTLAALVLAEGIFWWADDGAFPHLNLYEADAKLGARLVPETSMKLRVAKNPVTTVRINAQGFRGEDWPAERGEEVLVVGDSQVLGLGVEEDETFSVVLEKELGGKMRVLNAGVPTYGPPEYRAVAEKIGRERRPKHVVLVLNMVNDLLEARRPNVERHAIWDGWAVRKETAPSKAGWDFPGKHWLFNRSHAVFAVRRYFASQSEETRAVEESRLPSEGVFTDLIVAGAISKSEKVKAEAETVAHRGEFKQKVGELQTHARRSEDELAKKLAELSPESWIQIDLEGTGYYDAAIDTETQLRAARANPGDIVGTVSYAESTGPYAATAQVIRRGAALRLQLEKAARHRYEASRDAKAAEAVRLLDQLKEVDDEVRDLLAEPPERSFAWSPLKSEIEATKKLVEEWGGELTVLVLPFDVQVTAGEWKKYRVPAVDMAETLILNEDARLAARAVGARAVHPLEELRGASPGAFLEGDLHLTPKGHQAVAKALAAALKEPAPLPLPKGGLPEGRTRPPSPAALGIEADVKGSTAARCATYFRDGWFRAICSAHEGAAPRTVRLRGGLSREVQVFRTSEQLAFTLPFVAGNEVRGAIFWEDQRRSIEMIWPAAAESPTMTIGPKEAAGAAPAAAPLLDPKSNFCECVAKQGASRKVPAPTDLLNPQALPQSTNCLEGVLSPSEGCQAYAKSCDELLACANGDPWFTPECPEGEANAGALERCYQLCAPGVGSCPAHFSCEPWQGAHVCFPEGEQ